MQTQKSKKGNAHSRNVSRHDRKYNRRPWAKIGLPAKAGKRDQHCEWFPHCGHTSKRRRKCNCTTTEVRVKNGKRTVWHVCVHEGYEMQLAVLPD